MRIGSPIPRRSASSSTSITAIVAPFDWSGATVTAPFSFTEK